MSAEQLPGVVMSGDFDPFSRSFHENPYPFYKYFREHDPVHWGKSSTPEYPGSWYFFRHAEVAAALKDQRFSSQRKRPPRATGPDPQSFWRWISQWMLFRDPPDHTRLRNVVSRVFDPKSVRALAPFIEKTANRLIDELEDRQEFDVISDYAYILPADVMSVVLGVDFEDRERFREYSTQITQAIDLHSSEEVFNKGRQAVEDLVEFFSDILQQRREKKQDDLISRLTAAVDDEKTVSDEEMIAMCIQLLVAGHETTVHFIGSGVYELLKQREQLYKYIEAPELERNLVEEMLRYTSPVQMVPRIASEDISIGGKQIKAGDDITLVVASANRDEAVFIDPDRLDISRKPGKQSAFGLGPHFCLGAALARLEGQVAFRVLFNRLPGLALASGSVEYYDRIAFRGLAALPVTTGK